MKDNEKLINLIKKSISQYQKDLSTINEDVVKIQKRTFDDKIFDKDLITTLEDVNAYCKVKRKEFHMLTSVFTELKPKSNKFDELIDTCHELIEKYETIIFKINNIKLVVNRIIMDKTVDNFKDILKEKMED